MSTGSKTEFPKAPDIPFCLWMGSSAKRGPDSSLFDAIDESTLNPLLSTDASLVVYVTGQREYPSHAFHEQLSKRLSTTSLSFSNIIFGPSIGSKTYAYTLQVAPAASGRQINASIPLYSEELVSTALKGGHESLEVAIKRLLWRAEFTDFEDGFENDFTEQLTSLVKEEGSDAIEALARVIFRPAISADIAAQILLCLGRIEDNSSSLARSWLLQRGLFSYSSKVRDAAVVGIASLNDIRSTESLRKVIARERIQDLRADMERVLRQLQETTE